MGVMNLLEAATQFTAAAEGIEIAEHEIIETACEMLEGKANGLIGYPHSFWPPLAEETLRRKDGVNTPLLETGELRDSIQHNSDQHEGYVGSNNPKAEWHEFGTRSIPPRSFLGAAAGLEGPKIKRMAGEVMRSAIGGAPIGGALGELLHLAHEAARKVKDEFMDLVEDDDKETR
jgi:phage gpG-like protein